MKDYLIFHGALLKVDNTASFEAQVEVLFEDRLSFKGDCYVFF